MKKLVLTAAIILSLVMGSFAQNQQYIWGIFQRVGTYNDDDLFRRVEAYDDDDLPNRDETDDDNDFFYLMVTNDNGGLFHSGGGLFRRGKTYGGGMRDGGTFSLCFPGHNFTTNWNGGSQGHDDDLVPLGSGALLLVGFGAAYAMMKRKKKN